MATRGVSGKLLDVVGEREGENTRLGQAFVLFGLLSVVGGVGLLVLIETFEFEPEAFLTYQRIGIGVAGYGLPVFLYGVVVLGGGGRRETEAALVGGLLSTFAVILFVIAYSGRWEALASPAYTAGALSVYGFGTTLCSVGAGRAVFPEGAPDDGGADPGADPGIEIEAESEFIWGDPPED
jgi:hypothetical protein